MKIYTTGVDPLPTSTTEGLHVYNGIDCCVTLEVFQVIEPQLDEITRATYKHSLEMQGPILEMMCRGIKVDTHARDELIEDLTTKLQLMEAATNELVVEGVGYSPINPHSTQQVQKLLYTYMGIPPVRKRTPEGMKPTADRKALEKLRDNYWAEPIINHILVCRDLKKQIGTLRTKIDPDGRMRTTYSIGGTDTGRLSSYASCFGSGTNLQNIAPGLRKIFCADRGKKLAYVDLEQAESRAVGAIIWNLFQDPTYLDFCESGDLHTGVAMMTWKELPWHDDRPVLEQLHDPIAAKHNKKIAKQPFYREFSYRDTAKRLGHGTNYRGKPPHMASILRVPRPMIEEFQQAYLGRAFPGISRWHDWVKAKLMRDGWITTFMGRRRKFFGRRWEDETVRSAVAYEPQSAVGQYLNTGLLHLWRAQLPTVELMLQVHDAIVFQYDEDREDEIIPQVLKILQIEVPLMHGRSLVIPTEAFTGWNWGYAAWGNPDGLIEYKGNDNRRRTEAVGLLDRRLS
jgi:DNA polymerase I-like protein with 3'-5' exonuclease and polymerase domains